MRFIKCCLPILLAALWISTSEFLRNELLLSHHWQHHYAGLGLTFPSSALNGAVWGVWSLAFAFLLFVLQKKFSFWQTIGLGWFAGFVLMWLVVGNMAVLPLGLLPYAIPLSIAEVWLAVVIIKKTSPKQ